MSEPAGTKNCPFCAEEILAAAILCKHCRSDLTSIAVAPREQIEPEAVDGQAQLHCVACRSPAVQKVGAIFTSGTWSSASQGVAGGVGVGSGGGAVLVGGVYQGASVGSTVLADQLAPPRRPQYQRPGAYDAAKVFGAIAAIIGVITISIANSPGGGGGYARTPGILFLISFIAAVFFALKGAQQADINAAEHEAAMKRWEHVMSYWKELLYCSRCGSVSDPAAGMTASAENMVDLLRPYAALATAPETEMKTLGVGIT